MILFFGMQLASLGYGFLYLLHSIRKRRGGQAAATGALLLACMLALAVLLWELIAMP